MFKVLFLAIFAFFLVIFPKSTFAEIATVRDWVGFFSSSAGHTKADTVNGTSWAYTYNCTKTTPGPSAVPKLEDPMGCKFTLNPVPPNGSYELRLYAYDGSDQSALIATKDIAVGSPAPAPSSAPIVPGKIYHIAADGLSSGDLTVTSNITLNENGIIFVDGNLTIGPITGNKLTHTNENSGLVFVVKGDVIIDPSITQVDAVIVTSGTIYTAGANCASSSVTESSPGTPISQLTINGSLISLDPSKQIRFCRTLGITNSTTPAEVVNQQPKYLVILRHLFSETLQRWSEIQ